MDDNECVGPAGVVVNDPSGVDQLPDPKATREDFARFRVDAIKLTPYEMLVALEALSRRDREEVITLAKKQMEIDQKGREEAARHAKVLAQLKDQQTELDKRKGHIHEHTPDPHFDYGIEALSNEQRYSLERAMREDLLRQINHGIYPLAKASDFKPVIGNVTANVGKSPTNLTADQLEAWKKLMED